MIKTVALHQIADKVPTAMQYTASRVAGSLPSLIADIKYYRPHWKFIQVLTQSDGPALLVLDIPIGDGI